MLIGVEPAACEVTGPRLPPVFVTEAAVRALLADGPVILGRLVDLLAAEAA